MTSCASPATAAAKRAIVIDGDPGARRINVRIAPPFDVDHDATVRSMRQARNWAANLRKLFGLPIANLIAGEFIDTPAISAPPHPVPNDEENHDEHSC